MKSELKAKQTKKKENDGKNEKMWWRNVMRHLNQFRCLCVIFMPHEENANFVSARARSFEFGKKADRLTTVWNHLNDNTLGTVISRQYYHAVITNWAAEPELSRKCYAPKENRAYMQKKKTYKHWMWIHCLAAKRHEKNKWAQEKKENDCVFDRVENDIGLPTKYQQSSSSFTSWDEEDIKYLNIFHQTPRHRHKHTPTCKHCRHTPKRQIGKPEKFHFIFHWFGLVFFFCQAQKRIASLAWIFIQIFNFPLKVEMNRSIHSFLNNPDWLSRFESIAPTHKKPNGKIEIQKSGFSIDQKHLQSSILLWICQFRIN